MRYITTAKTNTHTIYNPNSYAKAELKLTVGVSAIDAERSYKMLYWTLAVITSSNAYLTYNKKIPWKVEINAIHSGDKEYTTYPTQSGTADINTDINDNKVIAEGIIEVPFGAYVEILTETDFTGVMFVDMRNETGKELNFVINNTKSDDFTYSITSMNNNAATFVSVGNFTDENAPILSYSGVSNVTTYPTVKSYISYNGYTEDIIRDIPVINNKTTQTYNYNFTEDERSAIYNDIPAQASKVVYVYLTTQNANNSTYYVRYVKRTMSVVNGAPTFAPIIKDVNATTLALTADENTLVRFHSNAYVESNVAIQKQAEAIVQHSVTVGSKSTNAYTHTFEGVESNEFIFSATDSRGFNTTNVVTTPFVDYVKLSCYIDYNPIGADTGVLDFSIKGNYYNGTFGAVSNNLGLVYRLKHEDNAWSNWVSVGASAITYDKNTYSAKVEISGLDYRSTYQLQAMATDRLNVITSIEYTLTTVPVYDWSKEDFNFNVPVNFSAPVAFQEGINAPVRFDEVAAFNDTATFEATAAFNGAAEFVGTANFVTAPMIAEKPINDFVIETGQEAMGSNGTWYWRKWASGRAECWGRRNFGNMGFGTALGNSLSGLYQSQEFIQTFPAIFGSTPDVINIDIIKSNGGAWILRGFDTSADAYNTGSFALAKAGNANLTQVYLGFYVCGTWIEE